MNKKLGVLFSFIFLLFIVSMAFSFKKGLNQENFRDSWVRGSKNEQAIGVVVTLRGFAENGKYQFGIEVAPYKTRFEALTSHPELFPLGEKVIVTPRLILTSEGKDIYIDNNFVNIQPLHGETNNS